ncbi:MAG: hypothetical protein AAGA85_20410 [Bacteroidota bacterium]
MKGISKFLFLALATVALAACNESDENQFRESQYLLHRIGSAPISGQVTFTELEPAKIQAFIELDNTTEGLPFPAHLHFGNVGETGELAFRLNDVDGGSGESLTVLDKVELTNGETLTFDLLQSMNGSVKIHLNDSFFKNIAVSSGNIGVNATDFSVFDGIAVCTGH